jgi:amino acid permease
MYPVSGAFSVFGTRFVSPALGFTLGEFIYELTAFAHITISFFFRMELLAAMVSTLSSFNSNRLCLNLSIT